MSSIWTVRRSPTDTKLAGLCGGVAEHWGIDPVLVRVGWVLLALSGGVGVVLYLAGWLLIPVQGRATAPVDDLLGDAARRWSREVWVALVVAACLAVFAGFGDAGPFGVGPAVVLVGIWYFGFARHRRNRDQPPAPDPGVLSPTRVTGPSFVAHPGPPTPFTAAAEAWRQRIEEHVQQSREAAALSPEAARGTAPDGPEAPVPDPAQVAHAAFLAQPDPVGLYADTSPGRRGAQPLPVRRGSRPAARRLRLATLLALGLTCGGLALADGRMVEVPPAAYAAAGLLVVGLALVAATWLGRARGLLPLGLLLVPAVALTSVLGPGIPLEGWDVERQSYSSRAELPVAGDALSKGELVVDLSRLRLDADATYVARVDTGHLEVIVPPDVDVALHYSVDRGVVQAYGGEPQVGRALVPPDPSRTPPASDPTLTLDLSVGRGFLEVRR